MSALEQNSGIESNSIVAAPMATALDEARIGPVLAEIVADHAQMLVSRFYDAFLTHDEASAFLDHGVVHDRLGRSLCTWLAELFPHDGIENADKVAEHQKKIGEVHARIRIPIHLVMEGAEHLKAGMTEMLIDRVLDAETTRDALILLNQRIDRAMRMMGAAYMTWTTRKVRVDEAYRLFSIGQDMNLERESQRASLMEWSQAVLFGLVGEGDGRDVVTLQKSAFGLWFRHRAGVIFHGAAGLDKIEARMHQIDGKILPALAEAKTRGNGLEGPLAHLQDAIGDVKYLLSDLFQSVTGMEAGIDPLTRALNRRFMPSILGREIGLARENDTQFSLLMLDIDHFKDVNDRYGHAAGDMVLREMAGVIVEHIRLSDFLFRYGGEEFLIALVETPLDDALRIAERIRTQFETQPIRLTDGEHIHATISVGVTSFDGHPDYDYLVRKADQALYRAKAAGRNRSVTG